MPVKKYLIAGLLVWLPLVVTIWVVTSVLSVLDSTFGWLLSATQVLLPASMHGPLEALRHIDAGTSYRTVRVGQPLLPPPPLTRPSRIVDFGSGAGFPGLVLAIMGAGELHLVESDQRKCAFLREAARITETPVTIHASRIETLPPLDADVVTARALAPLDKLLDWAAPHRSTHTIHIIPKGKEAEAELTKAAAHSTLEVTRHPSLTDPAATIFRIRVTDHD